MTSTGALRELRARSVQAAVAPAPTVPRPMDGFVPPQTAADLRAGADPVVWSHVVRAMRDTEARDALAFRVHPVGTGWRIATRLVMAVALLHRLAARTRYPTAR